ncbi:hypothetical protein D6764_00015 [Candidatus Woesearchaeota archaeon]|nr:MAG: hypothetical protein D6764_00015 [Candidatus Woesearchaeota archaeon]
MAMNKKGIELSANMIVVMVIAIAMLAMGLRFSTNFFQKAESLRLNLDKQSEDRIQQLLDDGALVANPLNRKEVKPGKSVIFAMGINNQLKVGADTSNDFRVRIQPHNTYGTSCSALNEFTISTINGAGPVEVSIPKNSKENILIGITAPEDAKRCTYVWNVYVEYDDSGWQTYGNSVYKLYLKVI